MAKKEGNAIQHPGIVESVHDAHLIVRVLSQSACGNCHSRAYCSMTDMQEKAIEVPRPMQQPFSPGQQVLVTLQENLGFRALFLGYLMPFLVLVGGVVAAMTAGADEAGAAITGIALMLPYYGLLYLLRDRIKRRFEFRIKPGTY